ncbi:lipocalin family protein [Larsenimonas suaedae]|uniref:Outer membrane lipoprotein Blc n=1 Tax=Larsenimonas suaedae TaxID=1851019 RepID=A0ABU1GU77_9GAMM|nr:lipocalin family protein [Larsenimonas suaedae]MCM2972036.1 lipocalin family protein [Larsenimonas suaedae]MDR5895589.1 lipocalin family protein [Larsenimonas suaedae]
MRAADIRANVRALWAALGGDPGIAKGSKAVEQLDLARYQGTWYEIARLNHPFERRLSNVTATYTPRDDGGVDVLNRGFDLVRRQWRSAKGVAYPAGRNTPAGRLKVSFFWRFFAGYNIIYLDAHYDHAIIVGPNRRYLWVLSRSPFISDTVFKELTHWLTRQGLPAGDLYRVHHDGFLFDPQV